MEHILTCELCGGGYPAPEARNSADRCLCPDCLSEHTLICSECGTHIMPEENEGTDAHPLCRPCFDNYYTTCSDCGALIRASSACYLSGDDDDDAPYCSDCYSSLSRSAIRDYYYKPTPIFYGDGPRYFGVELEIDEAGEINSNARQIMEVVNRSGLEYIYCKHDGSLNDGFEIVTHPMSLDFHLNGMPWRSALEEAAHLGYRSHQANTCGLHVHVSRNTFGASEEEQDTCIARILYFFEKHWEELLKFSRRTQRQLEQWSSRYGYKESPRDILKHAKDGNHGGRYTCVNLTNYDTIEFRIFRGTLKYNTLIATLQLIDRICDVALFMSDEELKAMSWSAFVSGCAQPELVQYLKERRLYVNDPVETEVEL